jgi:hypothetical protein
MAKTGDQSRAVALSSGLGRTALVFDDNDVVDLLRIRAGGQSAFARRIGFAKPDKLSAIALPTTLLPVKTLASRLTVLRKYHGPTKSVILYRQLHSAHIFGGHDSLLIDPREKWGLDR